MESKLNGTAGPSYTKDQLLEVLEENMSECRRNDELKVNGCRETAGEAYITFHKTVRIENIKGRSDEEIVDEAIELYNDQDMEGLWAYDDEAKEINFYA
ncbi:hypothetical protein IMZ31_24315 (plasmid) [Pontibacillus sp. ALD_SL1]|uniref:hypothetical protein n=1 Tax=Pontibacillus sp. ALD_SL1 TaxID=2777185 RepID=UPI001A96FBCC|nr:hypothetical protein [Pontibacillus sp. ALD_SL1]QST02578.1 hypothetical protein IMZ31_24315 [Pontibacillus sp. ALD_SL1]